MAQTVTAHSSFVYLVENIPDWQQEITTLSERTSTKNSEFKAEYIRLVNQIRPRRKKSPSLASIHTLDDLEQATSERPFPSAGPSDSNDLPSPPTALRSIPSKPEIDIYMHKPGERENLALRSVRVRPGLKSSAIKTKSWSTTMAVSRSV